MIYDVYEFMCVCVKLASRYTPICLSANRCISIASARPQKHTSLYINYSLYINSDLMGHIHSIPWWKGDWYKSFDL